MAPSRIFPVFALIILVFGIYGTRLTTLTIRGEEPRRAGVAKEMRATGEWFVPRLQGQPFLTRPPLQNWSIALCSQLTGDVRLAMRLPSALAIMLTTFMVFWYSSHFLRRAGAFAAAVSFATMAQVMELGRLAETEALFTFFVGASLLVWHLGYEKHRPAPMVWMAGYGVAALGALTKGAQAPAYFIGATCLYLVLRRDWRWLLGWSHLAGVLVFAVVFGAWGVPFFRKTGWPGVGSMLFDEVGLRFSDLSFAAIAGHLIGFPFQLLMCMLPWSLVLVCLCFPGAWSSQGPDQAHDASRPAPLAPPPGGCSAEDRGSWSQPVLFALVCLTVAFPTCWIPPGAHERYLMPLYPLVAVMIGAALQLCYDSPPGSTLDRFHRALVVAMAFFMIGAGLVILVISFRFTPDTLAWAQPRALAIAYFVFAAGAAGVLLRARTGRGEFRLHCGLLAVAGFMGLSMTGVFVNTLDAQSVDTESAIAELRKNLPVGHRMVSLGPVNPLFGFLYPDPIDRIDRLDDPLLLKEGVFFSIDAMKPLPGDARSLPFVWRQVAVIPVARRRDQLDDHLVFVGCSDSGQIRDPRPVSSPRPERSETPAE